MIGQIITDLEKSSGGKIGLVIPKIANNKHSISDTKKLSIVVKVLLSEFGRNGSFCKKLEHVCDDTECKTVSFLLWFDGYCSII